MAGGLHLEKALNDMSYDVKWPVNFFGENDLKWPNDVIFKMKFKGLY